MSGNKQRRVDLHAEILARSVSVDERFSGLSPSEVHTATITFRVPASHPRRRTIGEYELRCSEFDPLVTIPGRSDEAPRVVLACDAVERLRFVSSRIFGEEIERLVVRSIEGEVKTVSYMDGVLAKPPLQCIGYEGVLVVVGGGLLLNVGAYIAEQANLGLVLYPTTALAMADGAGGKVRLNSFAFGRAYKHYYKSYYEPDRIVIDPRFLNSLPIFQKRCGLVEIIKHGLFQSPALYNYLMQNCRAVLESSEHMLKAVLWAADLKRVCLDVDVEENENGSRRILRGGHSFSDRLEEAEEFTVPHGFAVAIGIVMEAEHGGDRVLSRRARDIFKMYDIPISLNEFRATARSGD